MIQCLRARKRQTSKYGMIFSRVFAKNERYPKAEFVLNLESIGTNLTISALEIVKIDENAQSSSVN